MNFARPERETFDDQIERLRRRRAHGRRTESTRLGTDPGRAPKRREFTEGRVCALCRPACGRVVYARGPSSRVWSCHAAYMREWRAAGKLLR